MEKKSEYNLTLHLKIIYSFLIVNVTLCMFCLYLLFNRQSDNDSTNILLNGKYNVTEHLLQQREKRDLYEQYDLDDRFLQQCSALSNICRQQTDIFDQRENYYARSRRLVDGIQGPPGPPGQPGIPGAKGDKGDTGERGHQGLLGFPGFKGDRGLKGELGPKGEMGPVGPAGLTGATGPRGAPGPAGIEGPPGRRGRKGDDGPPGAQGPPGFMGPQGSPGLKGDRGDPGLYGYSRGNCSCTKGIKGDKGSRGQLGFTGFKGDKGDMGLKGEPGTGYRGGYGTNGLMGPKGTKGDKGEKGELVVITSTENEDLKVRSRKFLPQANTEDRKVPLSQYKDSKTKEKSGNRNKSATLDRSIALLLVLQAFICLVLCR